MEYSEFEMLLSVLRPEDGVTGTGVIAHRNEFSKAGLKDEMGFLKDGIPLDAQEISAYIDAFPLSESAASYLFTILEVFGNDVAEKIKPGSINKNKAWHEDVRGFADLRDEIQVQKMREAFAKHFQVDPAKVTDLAVHQTVKLKKIRNEFAHDAQARVNFEDYLHTTIAVVCHIAFLVTDEDRFSVYPWEDHLQRFTPQSIA